MSELGDRSRTVSMRLTDRWRGPVGIAHDRARPAPREAATARALLPLHRSPFAVGFAGDRRTGLTDAVRTVATLIGLFGLGIALTGLWAC